MNLPTLVHFHFRFVCLITTYSLVTQKKILADKLFLSFLHKSQQWRIMLFFSGTWKVKLLLKKSWQYAPVLLRVHSLVTRFMTYMD